VGDGPRWSPPKYKPKPKPVEKPAAGGAPAGEVKTGESEGGAGPVATPEMKVPEAAVEVPAGTGGTVVPVPAPSAPGSQE
jgi:hypothetical protein